VKGARRAAALIGLALTSTQPVRADDSFGSRWGLAAAARLLQSDPLRGAERLAAMGEPAAADLLVQQLDAGGDRRVRLVAIRGLSAFVGYEPARQALAKAMALGSTTDDFLRFGQQTAALVLAASGEPSAIELVAAALHQGNPAARAALLAHPPASFSPLWSGKEKLTPALCAFFADLGDLRAQGLLRDVLRMPKARGDDVDRDVRIAAAAALARLGDAYAAPFARTWIRSSDAVTRAGALDVLVTSGEGDAAEAVVGLLADPATRAVALGQALRVPPDALSLSLGRLPDYSVLTAPDAIAVLARAPREMLRAALSRPATRRTAARAAALRALLAGDEIPELRPTLGALLASGDPGDRAVGAFCLSALGQGTALLLASADPVVVRSAARTLLIAGPDAVRAAVERLASERDETTRAALGLAFWASADAADRIATPTLLSWIEREETIAPMAVLALGSRERADTRFRLDRLLASPSPVMRAHAAVALGSSGEPDAAARLARAWSFEPAVRVRRWIVRALAQRTERQRTVALERITRFEPDEEAREIARAALAGQVPTLRPTASVLDAFGLAAGPWPFELASWPPADKAGAHEPGQGDSGAGGGP
jgi:hypothetical protein